MQEKYNANNESLVKYGFVLCINPLLLAYYFLSILNVPFVADFHPIGCLGIL